MTTWNHRIVKTDDEFGPYFELVEVFYDNKGRPYGYTNATIGGEDLESIETQLLMFHLALKKDVLLHPKDFTGDIDET